MPAPLGPRRPRLPRRSPVLRWLALSLLAPWAVAPLPLGATAPAKRLSASPPSACPAPARAAQVPPADPGDPAPATRWRWDAARVLILGNSLTLHPASAELDWPGEWGMAASSADRDYVHRLAARLQQATGQPPTLRVRNIFEFERGYTTYDFAQAHAADRDFRPTLIVLAIGENMEPLASDHAEQRFYRAVCQLLDELTRAQPATVVVRSGFWRSPRRDRALASAACASGGLFVDCGDLGAIPEYAARSERDFRHAAVGAHPGDRGMAAIADRIWQRLKQEHD